MCGWVFLLAIKTPRFPDINFAFVLIFSGRWATVMSKCSIYMFMEAARANSVRMVVRSVMYVAVFLGQSARGALSDLPLLRILPSA